MGGRIPIDSVTDHIVCTPQPGGKVHQRCKHCSREKNSTQLQMTMWRLHLVADCPNVDPAVSKEIWENTKSQNVRLAGEKRGFGSLGGGGGDAKCLAVPTSSVASAKKRAKTELSSKQTKFHAARPRKDSSALSLAVSEFVFGCGLPSTIVESKHFRSMVKAFDQQYTLPSAESLQETYLPKLNDTADRKTQASWNEAQGDGYLATLASFRLQNGGDREIHCLVEHRGDAIAFRKCAETTVEASAEAVATIWKDQMSGTAQGDRQIGDIYGAVCADSSHKSYADAGKMIEEEFPTVLFNGCRTAATELLCKDIANVPEISKIIKESSQVVEFVLRNQSVKSAYARIMLERGGAMVASCDKAHFGCVDSMFSSIFGPNENNLDVLQSMTMEPQWQDETCSGISFEAQSSFESLVSSPDWYKKIRCLRELSKPFAIFYSFMGRVDVRPSWIVPAFDAIQKDIECWSSEVSSIFEPSTLDAVDAAFKSRWFGANGVTGLYSSQLLLAMMVDPCTSPDGTESLPPGWDDECMKLFQRYYRSDSSIAVENELAKLVDRQGKWGEDVRKYQSSFLSDNFSNKYNVERLAEELSRSVVVSPVTLWKIRYKMQFPTLLEPATRVCGMATRSSEVDRVCDLHSLFRSHKNMDDQNVRLLLQCHINLGLLAGEAKQDLVGGYLTPLDATRKAEVVVSTSTASI